MKRTHFHILYRQFLFRLMDVEMLSGSAAGDSNVLLGQLGALLIFGSVVLCLGAAPMGQAVRDGSATLWGAERFMISLTLLVVGVFGLLSWDAAFLDQRDVLVLGPLPVRGRTLLAAKVSASASALGLTVVAWNCVSGLVWPLVLAPSSGLVAIVRFVAAYWVALGAAAIFMYSTLLALQGVAAQLPRRWFLRLSSALQITAFVVLVAGVCLQLSIQWSPVGWFVGLFGALSGLGSPQERVVMWSMAQLAVRGLEVSTAIAACAYLLSYKRTLRGLVESPDAVGGARSWIRLPRIGNLPESALMLFVVRTALRSTKHRAIVAFYLGGGFAIAAVYLEGAMDMMHCGWVELLWRVNSPLLTAGLVLLCAASLGVRNVFSLPVNLRANWIFRVLPLPEGKRILRALRRAFLAMAVVPVSSVSSILVASFWPWRVALGHALLLCLLGSALGDGALRAFRKIPFACSFLPGKSKVHMVFWFGIVPLLGALDAAGRIELAALTDGWRYCELVMTLAAVAVGMRWLSKSSSPSEESELEFEERRSDELIGLGL